MEHTGLPKRYFDSFIRQYAYFTPKNKIIYADNPIALYAYAQQEGHKFGESKGYVRASDLFYQPG